MSGKEDRKSFDRGYMGHPKGKCAHRRKKKAKNKKIKQSFEEKCTTGGLESSNKRDRLDASRRLVKGINKSGLEDGKRQRYRQP